MHYLVSAIFSLLIPPCLIGITSTSDKTEKKISLALFTYIVLFMQINWGRNIFALNVLAIVLTLGMIIMAVVFRDSFSDALKILSKTINNFLNELRDPIMSTKETVKILLIKDIVTIVLSLLRLIRPFQATTIIAGTFIYLIVVEVILQENSELKASYNSFLNYIRNTGSFKGSAEEGDEGGEYYEQEEFRREESNRPERNRQQHQNIGDTRPRSVQGNSYEQNEERSIRPGDREPIRPNPNLIPPNPMQPGGPPPIPPMNNNLPPRGNLMGNPDEVINILKGKKGDGTGN